ncbi:asparagine synthase-related protein [Adlercreutzia sp. ZJ138]|uniref:asparagine synthase-related protein n=1 Tax=Adlercreutzia sp. ZJ138 TaxID=2709405 RepID=UPI0013ED967C|nr:asparagine synthase-related protein [Adlercreutzia sp. ZJ138]
MQINVLLKGYKSYSWKRVGRTSLIGNLKIEDENRLITAAEKADPEPCILNSLTSVDSFFAMVIETEDKVLLVSDHLSSFPLFYSVQTDRGDIVISDEAEACSISKLANKVGMADYRVASVTMGSDTLWSDVMEVESGSIVRINKADGEVKCSRYWIPIRSFAQHSSTLSEVDYLAESVFGDIVRRYANKPIVVPITSGIDSRTIAVMLKRGGHEKVHTFSIGKRTDEDVKVGFEVAKALGLPWTYVDLTGEMWESYYKSDAYKEALLYAIGGGRLNHVLMAHAIKILDEASLIPEEAIFMPGHAGSIMGGELKRIPFYEKGLNRHDVAVIACAAESRIATLSKKEVVRISRAYEQRMSQGKEHLSQNECFAEIDTIHTQDYIFKFIVNDVRNYELFGYRWHLPLMEKRWCEFWLNASFNDAYGKALITSYVNQESKPFGLHFNRKPMKHGFLAKALWLHPVAKGHARVLKRRIAIGSSERPVGGYFDAMSDVEYKRMIRRWQGVTDVMDANFVEESIQELKTRSLLVL